jgi:hypothetical protein
MRIVIINIKKVLLGVDLDIKKKNYFGITCNNIYFFSNRHVYSSQNKN